MEQEGLAALCLPLEQQANAFNPPEAKKGIGSTSGSGSLIMTKSNSKLGEKKEGVKGEVQRTSVMLRQPI